MLTIEERKKIFNQKKQKIDQSGKIVAGFVNTTFGQFEVWFNQEIFAKGCHYCGTTNDRSRHLYDVQRSGLRPDATRGEKEVRG